MISVVSAISYDNAEKITIIRKMGGEYNSDGIFIDHREKKIKALGSVQPLDYDNDASNEQQKVVRDVEFIVNRKLNISDSSKSTNNDIILYKGDKYTLRSLEDFSHFGYSKCVGSKIK